MSVTTIRDEARVAKRDALFPDLPDHMKGLPVDHRGFPVPWFVAWVNGEPSFPTADGAKFERAMKGGRCWVCGGTLGKFRASVIGPMCSITRTISEPQSHVECARFSARHCPFLANPRMGRVPEQKLPDDREQPAGHGLKRNPGAVAVWITRTASKPFMAHTGAGGILFDIGEPDAVEWYAHGREAFRDEVLMSIKTGIPALLELCASDPKPGAFEELGRRVQATMVLVPRNAGPGVTNCIDCQKPTSDSAIIGCTKVDCPLFPEEMAS